MSNYPEWIKYYGSATGLTIDIQKTMHITWIKNFFKQMNMRKSYKKQILDHNIEKFSLMVRLMDMFSFTKTLIEADKNVELQVNSVNGAKSITEDLKLHIMKNERIKLRHN